MFTLYVTSDDILQPDPLPSDVQIEDVTHDTSQHEGLEETSQHDVAEQEAAALEEAVEQAAGAVSLKSITKQNKSRGFHGG